MLACSSVPRFARHRKDGRPAVLVLLALALSVVLGCREGAPSAARITMKAAGGEIVFGGRRGDLPGVDFADAGKDAPPITQDDSGHRLAYPASRGMDRVVYVIGDGLFIGPLVAHPADFRAVPSVDHALGPLFEAAGTRRGELVREVRREKGERGLVSLLIGAVYVDDVVWEEASRELAPASRTALQGGLESGLEKGRPAILLRRAAFVKAGRFDDEQRKEGDASAPP